MPQCCFLAQCDGFPLKHLLSSALLATRVSSFGWLICVLREKLVWVLSESLQSLFS